MANLRQFLGLTTTSSVCQVYVFPPDRDGSPQNGGRCCLLAVPAGITQIKFEVWGGGGDGNGACCCQWPYTNGGSGSYAERIISTSAGCCFTVCAGSTGCCNNNCCGTCGFPSFVQCASNSTVVVCGFGGCGGRALCFYKNFACTGICEPSYNAEANCGFHNGQGLGKATIVGISKTSNYCAQDMWEVSHGTPKFNPNSRKGWDQCAIQFTRMGCEKLRAAWPGQGAIGGSSCGGPCCWGAWGAAGLVVVTMYS